VLVVRFGRGVFLLSSFCWGCFWAESVSLVFRGFFFCPICFGSGGVVGCFFGVLGSLWGVFFFLVVGVCFFGGVVVGLFFGERVDAFLFRRSI